MGNRSPRLQFTAEERETPQLKQAIQTADKKAAKLEKAEAKIPKKTVKKKERKAEQKLVQMILPICSAVERL